MPLDDFDRTLLQQIREGDAQAWTEFIARFEGRLMAYVVGRVRDRGAAEDVVQEVMLGFLLSLPNYNDSTPLESFLFAIAAHKLTDHLRRTGCRPKLTSRASRSDEDGDELSELIAPARRASSIARSAEQRGAESRAIAAELGAVIRSLKARGEFERLMCIELLFVAGLANKAVATELGISEQAVANHKHAVVTRLRESVGRALRGPSAAVEALG